MARLDWFNFLRILWRREMNMVLYYLLLRGWLHLGDSVAFIRGLSVIFAVAAIPAIFLLGRKLLGTRFGLVSALLLSVNAFQVRYAQEARSYSLSCAAGHHFDLLSSHHLAAIETGPEARLELVHRCQLAGDLCAFLRGSGSGCALGCNSHHEPNGSVSIAGRHSRTIPPCGAADLHCWTAPIWIFIATTGAGPIAWIPRPGLNDIIGLLKKLSGNADTPLLILYSVCVLAGLVAGIVSVRPGGVQAVRPTSFWRAGSSCP